MKSWEELSRKEQLAYDQRHGGAWDRGSADSYYGRPRHPHYFVGATYQSEQIFPDPGSPEYEAYMAGYDDNEASGSKKEW